MSKNNTAKTTTENEVTKETAALEVDITKLDNKGVIEQIRALTAERKAKREATEAAVNQLWADYKKWREENYKPAREKLLAQFSNNHDARIAKREERKAEALEKAKARKEKAEAKIAALQAASEKTADNAEAPVVEA